MSPDQPQTHELDLATVLAALSDPVRLRMVEEIARRGRVPCGTLDVPVTKSTRSHHLRVLREAGVTETRVEGVERLVNLRRADLDARFPGLLDSVLSALTP